MKKNGLETMENQLVENDEMDYIEESFSTESINSNESLELLENSDEQESEEDHEDVSSSSFETTNESIEVEEAFIGSRSTGNNETEGELEFVEGFDQDVLEMERESIISNLDEENLLDAWYADLGDPTVERLLKKQPELIGNTEVVIGRDDRIRINGTRSFPWRSICSLLITAKDGSRWIGTGWLAGPRLVITAGHVVYMHDRGGWAKSIEVIPGRNGSARPFGSCKSTKFHSVKGWTNKKKRSHDYGAIVLSKDCKFGSTLGYFGFARKSFFNLLGMKVNLSGYPGDKTAGTQWWHARKIKLVTSRTLVYNIDSAGGQSGSPVWQYKNGKRYAVGIHTNGSRFGNSATRITKAVFNNLKKWKNAYR